MDSGEKKCKISELFEIIWNSLRCAIKKELIFKSKYKLLQSCPIKIYIANLTLWQVLNWIEGAVLCLKYPIYVPILQEIKSFLI